MPDDQQQENQDVTLDQLQEELNQTINNWKRTAADFENYKKRKEAENRELVEFAREVTVAKLLPTIDTLEQALRHLPEYSSTSSVRLFDRTSSPQGEEGGEGSSPSSPSLEHHQQRRREGDDVDNGFAKKYQNWQAGISGILLQLDKALEELGVKKIEAIGKKFDPHFHEAIKEVESDQDDHIIIDELQSGFMLNGKVIRPSQVVISKKK